MHKDLQLLLGPGGINLQQVVRLAGVTGRVSNVKGFTIVELLIVIVVIAILTAISVVVYNGLQSHARGNVRRDAAAKITKALELYYIDNQAYPTGTGTGISSTDVNFLAALRPYMDGTVPADPTNNGSYVFRYSFFVPSYIFNTTTNCCSGDYVSTGTCTLE